MDAYYTDRTSGTCIIACPPYAAGPLQSLAEGADVLGHNDGVTRILLMTELRSYAAPEAADAIRQQAERFMNYRKSDQAVDEYTAECGLLRRITESKMEMGAEFPGNLNRSCA